LKNWTGFKAGNFNGPFQKKKSRMKGTKYRSPSNAPLSSYIEQTGLRQLDGLGTTTNVVALKWKFLEKR